MTTDIVTPSLPGEEVVAPSGRPARVPGTGSGMVWRTVRYGLLIAFVIIMLMPLYVLVVTSFKNGSDIGVNGQWNLPTSWTLKSWDKAWERLHDSFLRTFELAIPVALISSFVGAANGFVLSRWRFPGADVVFTLILFGMFIPYQAIMIPLGDVLNETSIQKGIPRLILVHVIYGLPICTLIFRNYYATTVPVEMIEAANVDGAGRWRTFVSITLPHLSRFLQLATLLGAIYIVNSFDAIFLMTQGGPGTASTNLPYYIYQRAFEGFDVGQSSAMGVIVVILTMIVATFALRLMFRTFSVSGGIK